ncbi:monovalent cation/H+ antiporter subunit D [Paracoccus sp. (in: a-proteobacteria)]|uniref:monovalent cation/H+ antiporter subunit D n=1 Tax=Paracoccus sp. TaxID=267 RepID=UPI0026E05D30|nr:monovalent cation/H+ antiporter subunit D [Paracoccus sp. (in: a-proteobacteria)]MDO5368741.1 monovalent cation/H+ antiporter subunit D [Paracoccus sp. (in: a-proteobacteria)]
MISPAHIVVLPILIPLLAGGIMLMYDERQRRLKLAIGILSCVLQLAAAIALVDRAGGSADMGRNIVTLYLLGDWPSPFGIVLVLDRLAAVMLLLSSIVALPALLYAGAGWHRNGQHFSPLFQFLLMGVNGSFLTGDLFNLFVFFEVMLAASYGLLLHGTGRVRVGAGLHYIAVNLVAAMLFLLGVSLIYGATGTLNMADLASRIPRLSEADRPMVHAAAALLSGAFLVKAAMWPLCFWLPNAYGAASPPVAAVFSLLTKVGAYVVIRLGLLLFGAGAGDSAGFGANVLAAGGMATMIFGALGVLQAQDLGRMTGNLVLVSSGTLLAVVGLAQIYDDAPMLTAALYYMIASTIAIAALFLLAEPIGRKEGGIAGLLAITAEAYADPEEEIDEPTDEGRAIPGATALLGVAFLACVLVVAGLPPLAGFLGKFGMLSGAVERAKVLPGMWGHWAFVVLLIVTGFCALVAMVRWGIQSLWANTEEPPLPMLEIVPILMLVATVVLLSIQAEPALRYLERTADALTQNQVYIGGVLTAPPVGSDDP